MNKGSCLCGGVTWELSAEPFHAFNCHCTMCRKAHGTAFGTYWFVEADRIRMTGETDLVRFYRSSDVLTRASCDVCGSVTPYVADDGETWVAPGGCHDDGRGSDYDIFVVDNAPWHELTGRLPRRDAYPPETGIPSVPYEASPPNPDGSVRGSCLCGAIAYRVTEPFSAARYCHCSRCRRARAAAFASNAFTSLDGVAFERGADNLRSYELPGARYFAQTFCKTCGSPMPRRDPERGVCIVPMGGLDDDPVVRPSDHIFTGSMAGWHEIAGDLPRFEEGPD